ncbi:unnamed protein product, partial [Aphanomyces euteiches]
MPLNEKFAVELHHEQFKTKVILAAAYSFSVDDYGDMIGHLILSTIEPYVPIADWFQYVLLGVSSLVFAGLAIRNEGPTMIVGTAGLGAHMISYGAYFATLPPVRSDGKYWIPAVITDVVAAIAI